MTGPFLPLARSNNLIVQKMDTEILLFDSATDKAHVLNETAALVWKLSNGKRTVEQLTELVARELHVAASQDLVWLALQQLSKAGLLEQSAFVLPAGARLSRRDFLQKAAYGAILLPVIKTISAPTVQQSASQDCFAAGTLVALSDGTRRPIETLEIGEQVLARDEQTGVTLPQPIEKIYLYPERQPFQLNIGTTSLNVTAPHPFYTDGGWVRAIELRAGMDCVLQDGARATVQSIEHSLPHPQTVYNLKVSGAHTYFVGAQGVWVHNKQ